MFIRIFSGTNLNSLLLKNILLRNKNERFLFIMKGTMLLKRITPEKNYGIERLIPPCW